MKILTGNMINDARKKDAVLPFKVISDRYKLTVPSTYGHNSIPNKATDNMKTYLMTYSTMYSRTLGNLSKIRTVLCTLLVCQAPPVGCGWVIMFVDDGTG